MRDLNVEYSMDTATENAPVEDVLKKKFGLAMSISIVIGNVIGTGIFLNAKSISLAFPNGAGFSLLLVLFGGICALFGGISYIELSYRMPKSGGERTYLAETFGSPYGVSFTYATLFLVMPIALAYGAKSIGSYITRTFMNDKSEYYTLVELSICFSSLVLTFIVNMIGKRQIEYCQKFLTFTKFAVVVTIIATGMYFLYQKKNIDSFEEPFLTKGWSLATLTTSISASMWTYDGWNSIAMMSGEIANPRRNLPIAIVLGLVCITVLYIMIFVAYIAVLGLSKVSQSEAVALEVGVVAYSKYLIWLMPVCIAISSFGTNNGTLFSCARLGLVAGYEGEIPIWFSLVTKGERQPVIVYCVLILLSCFFVPIELDYLLDCGIFIQWIFYFGSMVCIFYYRYRDWKLEKMKKSGENVEEELDKKYTKPEFTVPIILPIFVSAASVYLIATITYSNPIFSSMSMAILLVVFLFFKYKHKSPMIENSLTKLSGFNMRFLKFMEEKCGLEPANRSDIE